MFNWLQNRSPPNNGPSQINPNKYVIPQGIVDSPQMNEAFIPESVPLMPMAPPSSELDPFMPMAPPSSELDPFMPMTLPSSESVPLMPMALPSSELDPFMSMGPSSGELDSLMSMDPPSSELDQLMSMDPPRKKWSFTKIIIIGLLIGLLVIGIVVGAIFLWKYYYQDSQSTDDDQSTTDDSTSIENPKFIMGSNKWKYTTDNTTDLIDCLPIWDLYDTDGTTIIAKDIARTTNLNRDNTWCATTSDTNPVDRVPQQYKNFYETNAAQFIALGLHLVPDLAKEVASKFAKEAADEAAAKSAKALEDAMRSADDAAKAAKAAQEASDIAKSADNFSIINKASDDAAKSLDNAAEALEKAKAAKALATSSDDVIKAAKALEDAQAAYNAAELASKETKVSLDAFIKNSKDTIAKTTADLANATALLDSAKNSAPLSEAAQNSVKDSSKLADELAETIRKLKLKVAGHPELTSLINDADSTSSLLSKYAKSLSDDITKKVATKNVFKTKIKNLAQVKFVPKMNIRAQGIKLMKASKTFLRNGVKSSANILKNLSTLNPAKLKTIGKNLADSSTKILKKLRPGPSILFDVVSIALDLADVGGYDQMQTKSGLYKTKSDSDKEFKENMFKAYSDAYNEIGLTLTLDDFVWPIVVNPMDALDPDEFQVKLMLKFQDLMASTETNNPDPIMKPFIDTINADISAGKITQDDLSNDEVFDKYFDLIDQDAIITLVQNETCTSMDGVVYDSNKCSLSETACNSSYSWPLQGDNNYVEFKEGKCQLTNPTMRQTCEYLNIPYDPVSGICKIDKEYCTNLGATYQFNEDIGENDCSIPIGQQIAEALFGVTITRTVLKNTLKTLEAVNLVFTDPGKAVTDLSVNVGDMYVQRKIQMEQEEKERERKKKLVVSFDNPGQIKIDNKCVEFIPGKYPKLQLRECSSSDKQLFQSTQDYQIVFKGNIDNKDDPYCWEAPNNEIGTKIFLNKCKYKTKNQEFKQTDIDSRRLHVQNNCVSYDENNYLQIGSCDVPTGTVRICSDKTGYCIENGGGLSANDRVITFPWNGGPPQSWKFNKDNGTICSAKTNRCLENGGKYTPGNNVGAYGEDDGKANKKWLYNPTKKTICNVQTGLCLENGGGATSGNTIAAYTDDGISNKNWTITYL